MTLKKNKKLLLICIFLTFSQIVMSHQDFQINDVEENMDEGDINQVPLDDRNQFNNYPSQEQIQVISRRRTACLILSRYYTNQFNQQISTILQNIMVADQQNYINKMYALAIQQCQTIISDQQTNMFFTVSQQNFDPSGMFYIFENFSFDPSTIDYHNFTPNQKNIVKFIKQFDAEMEVRREQQEAQQGTQEQRNTGVQIFFLSMNNLSPHMKIFFIALVVLISGGLVWYGFSQIDQKPQKKKNKRRKNK